MKKRLSVLLSAAMLTSCLASAQAYAKKSGLEAAADVASAARGVVANAICGMIK